LRLNTKLKGIALATELRLVIDNLRYDISCCKVSGLTKEKILQRINKIEAGIEALTLQVTV
jgi:hypothetical protein